MRKGLSAHRCYYDESGAVIKPQIDCIGAPPSPEGLEDVRRWRHEYARRLGFDAPEAALIAHRVEIDTHLLERLIRRGSSPHLALEIVR
jgi:hypothetical protein